MILYPAIDLKEGACVRLRQGDMGQATVFGTDPAAQARAFAAAGFAWIHVVDLDGAVSGRAANADAVRSILDAVTLPIQLGGGIRDSAAIELWLAAGVRRVVLGTAAVDDLCGVIEDADVDTDVRGSAAFILGKVGDERCVDSLIRGLAGADESLGLSICMAIAVFGESAAAKLKLAEQEDPAIAEGADCGQAAMDHVRRAFKEAGF